MKFQAAAAADVPADAAELSDVCSAASRAPGDAARRVRITDTV